MPLDQSRPLTIPPSIIYWSAKYKLPVYAHPRFEPGSSRIYARPYARSTDGFSDYSAAEERQKLKLPPLEDPPIVRPRQILYSLDCQWCPDEDELAAKVAALLSTLRPDDEVLPEPSPSPTYPPGSTPLTRWAAFLENYPRTLKKVKKRKRELEGGDGGDAKCASPAPSVQRPPVIKDERSRDVSILSTKRRRINDSSPSFPNTNTQPQLHDTRVAEDSPESEAAGDEEHRPNGSSCQEAPGF
ncbi:hypothetical protein PENSPDRAFT_656834 [Peniophora sp. CONT]|nr:hypothetical protein PENSPDRAFT_656834 [Peniophora sp. CONT]